MEKIDITMSIFVLISVVSIGYYAIEADKEHTRNIQYETIKSDIDSDINFSKLHHINESEIKNIIITNCQNMYENKNIYYCINKYENDNYIK